MKLTIIGKGGHGAAPHQTSDATIIAAVLINKLNRKGIKVKQIESGSAFNIISGNAVLEIDSDSIDVKLITALQQYYACQIKIDNN